jgi:hypothetical protein
VQKLLPRYSDLCRRTLDFGQRGGVERNLSVDFRSNQARLATGIVK